MANEIQAAFAPGYNLYAVILDPATGKVWNGSGFETPVAADWGNYAVALTQQSTTPLYEASFPAGITAPALYAVAVYKQAGGSPATSDVVIGTGSILWGGAGLLAGDELARPVPNGYFQGTVGWALGRIGLGVIQVMAAVDLLGNITIVTGLDYYAADGRSLDFNDPGNWPSLSGAQNPVLNIFSSLGGGDTTFTGSVVTLGPPQKIRFEPPASFTQGLTPGSYHYRITVVLSNGHTVDLGGANLRVLSL